MDLSAVKDKTQWSRYSNVFVFSTEGQNGFMSIRLFNTKIVNVVFNMNIKTMLTGFVGLPGGDAFSHLI